METSCLAAIAFEELDSAGLAAQLGRFDRHYSSNPLEAELRAAARRSGFKLLPA